MTRLDNYKETLKRCPEAARQLRARAREDEDMNDEEWDELVRCAVGTRACSPDDLLPEARERLGI